MNMNLTNTTLVIAGLVLIYCAIKDVDPRDVIKNALQGKATAGSGLQGDSEEANPGKGVGKVPAPGSGSVKVPGRATTTA